jgi:transcriptional antiterminator NusG
MMIDSEESKWYALYTKPRNEKKAAEELSKKGFEVFMPVLNTVKQWSDRKKKVQIPMFNSYIFVNTHYEKYYLDILQTNGIVKFVRIGKELSPIRNEQINYIKTFLTHEYELQVIGDIRPNLNQPVEIMEGPFKGMKGKLVEYRHNQYFAIEIEQIGANLLVTLPFQYLKL